jgi:hypothetical protein
LSKSLLVGIYGPKNYGTVKSHTTTRSTDEIPSTNGT